MLRTSAPVLFALLGLALLSLAQDGLRGGALREALEDKADELWIYDDVEAGCELARQEHKPLLVSFRCVP